MSTSIAHGTLRAQIAPSGLVADAVLVLGGALLTAAAAQISISLPFSPVPITAQTFAVLGVGAALGSARGLISMLAYVALGAIGLPFYAGGESGWTQVSGASGGYLIGFIAAAAITGAMADRQLDRRISTAVGAMLTGNVVIYLIGLPWLSYKLDVGLAKTLEYGLYPFVPGDILKLYAAAAALPVAWRIVGRRR